MLIDPVFQISLEHGQAVHVPFDLKLLDDGSILNPSLNIKPKLCVFGF